ncbi:MAG TPA: TIGR00282 family metallophosphoesterase [Spirochaetota bacterium]|nr:TIGR00282 family metallophosphoesterase [Spirochaetota bacterium]
MATKELNVLMLGDAIGNPGIEDIFLKLPALKKKEKIHLAIVNGENSNDGFGISEANIKSYRQAGIDVITSGNHIWSTRDVEKLLTDYNFLLRPANYSEAVGKGYWIGEIEGVKVGVVNLMGRYYMTPIDCPFQTLTKLLKSELKNCQVIIVDFHAEFLNEKITLAFDFDGRVSLVAGTHTHCQTADEKILPKGTGYITDLGMCGGLDSVIGMDKSAALEKISSQTMVQFVPSRENAKIQGIIATIDTETKKTINIKRFNF